MPRRLWGLRWLQRDLVLHNAGNARHEILRKREWKRTGP